MKRAWMRRAGAGVVAFAGLEVLLVVVGADPDPVRLALLVAVGTAVFGVLVDALATPESTWAVEVERPAAQESGDPRLVRNVALLEAHLSSRAPDHTLRDRLAVLTDQVLRQRHGVRRTDAAARDLLGPELTAVLDGPPRRLSRAEIDRCLTLLEEL